MKVSDIMNRWIKKVTPETRMYEVVPYMCLHRLPGLPVVDDDENLVGFIAEKDVLHFLFPSLEDVIDGGGMASIDYEAMENDYRNVLPLKVADLMTQGVITVSPEMPVLKAVSVMVRNRFRRIPVVDGGKLVGILSLGDVHKALFTDNFNPTFQVDTQSSR